MDQDTLYKKNNELVELYQEKSKKEAQTRQLYNKLKAHVQQAQIQTAASDPMDQTLHSISGSRNSAFDNPGLNQQYLSVSATPRARPSQQVLVDHNRVEQLHHHRRSGGGGSGGYKNADTAAMPPPGRPIAALRNRKTFNPKEADFS